MDISKDLIRSVEKLENKTFKEKDSIGKIEKINKPYASSAYFVSNFEIECSNFDILNSLKEKYFNILNKIILDHSLENRTISFSHIETTSSQDKCRKFVWNLYVHD